MTKVLHGVLMACALIAGCYTLGADKSAANSSRGDDRTPITLSPAERVHFREGMRGYLESIEGIIDGMTKHKMPLVAKAAKKSGMGMVKDVSVGTAISLPPEFVMMSVDTHEKFDDLAKEAKEVGTKLAVMNKLSTLMANCNACHSGFRLSPR